MSISHVCKVESEMCNICGRPEMNFEIFSTLGRQTQVNFCPLVNEPINKNLECKYCKKTGKNKLCFEIHYRARCQKLVECEKCGKNLRLVGKYSPKNFNGKVKAHTDCDEVLCLICNDYVLGLNDLKNPEHVCYVPAVKIAKKWPAGIACFDFEAYPSDETGTFKINHCHLITQKEAYHPQSEFVGVYFTDLPIESVKLNNQDVRPGREYTPEMDQELRKYFPFEMFKQEMCTTKEKKKSEVNIKVN